MKDKSISITFDELALAQSKAIATFVYEHPAAIILAEELATVAGITCNILFDEKEE